MKIVCPSCQAQYEVPEVVLTSRRKMRCARCGSEWVPADARAAESPPPPAAEAQIAPAVFEPAAPPEPAVAEIIAPPPPIAPPPHDVAHEPAQESTQEPAQEEDELAMMADPALSWTEAAAVPHEAESVHELELEPVVPVEPIVPPYQPVAVRPETPVTVRPEAPVSLRNPLPDPIRIVVPPAAKGPPVMEWAISVSLVVALVAAVVIFRGPIMNVWPPSLRLYAALGMGAK